MIEFVQEYGAFNFTELFGSVVLLTCFFHLFMVRFLVLYGLLFRFSSCDSFCQVIVWLLWLWFGRGIEFGNWSFLVEAQGDGARIGVDISRVSIDTYVGFI